MAKPRLEPGLRSPPPAAGQRLGASGLAAPVVASRTSMVWCLQACGRRHAEAPRLGSDESGLDEAGSDWSLE